MSYDGIDTTGKRHFFINFFSSLSVNCFIVFGSFELLLCFGGGMTNGITSLFKEGLKIPIVVLLTASVIIHTLLMMPGLICSFFSPKGRANGLFIMNVVFACLNIVYIVFLSFVALIPWWYNYIKYLLR